MLPLLITLQMFFAPHFGMSSRLGWSAGATIETDNLPQREWNRMYITNQSAIGGRAIINYEFGFGGNAGGEVTYTFRRVQAGAGAAYFIATNKKLVEGSRFYPVVSFRLRDSNETAWELRYIGDTFQLNYVIKID